MFIYQCLIKKSRGKEGVKTVCLDLMISPGVSSALIKHSESVTIITPLIYQLLVSPVREQQCFWTSRAALCPSTASLTHTHSHTYTHSHTHSLNLYTLDLHSITTLQCLCVTLNIKHTHTHTHTHLTDTHTHTHTHTHLTDTHTHTLSDM